MKVLFCGGPWNGRWKEVTDEDTRQYVDFRRIYEAPMPPTPRDMVNGTGTLTKFRYRLWTINVLGSTLDVAAPEEDHNESDSVLYALLQRDVADHLRGRS